jgi:hypothetical protein
MANHHNGSNGANGSFWGSRFMWMLVGMMIVVVVLAVLALRSPISQPTGERVITLTVTSVSPEDNLMATPEPESIVLQPEDFLDPEEIGHTDNIIFWSTMLLIILLVGTFRETFLRKNRK